MANVSTRPRSEAGQRDTAGPDSTSRAPPATACATHPISGTPPVSSATAATRAGAEEAKSAEANSTANEGGSGPSEARASATAWRAAASASAVRTRDPPAFTWPGSRVASSRAGNSERRPFGIFGLLSLDDRGALHLDVDRWQRGRGRAVDDRAVGDAEPAAVAWAVDRAIRHAADGAPGVRAHRAEPVELAGFRLGEHDFLVGQDPAAADRDVGGAG